MRIEKVVDKKIRGRISKSRINADVSGVIAGNIGEMGSRAVASSRGSKRSKQAAQSREGGEKR